IFSAMVYIILLTEINLTHTIIFWIAKMVRMVHMVLSDSNIRGIQVSVFTPGVHTGDVHLVRHIQREDVLELRMKL
ncbi:hypothetical protein D7J76_26245, partial [Salmonella enterica]|nr:hypothetical protein [Salmonella enterica]